MLNDIYWSALTALAESGSEEEILELKSMLEELEVIARAKCQILQVDIAMETAILKGEGYANVVKRKAQKTLKGRRQG